METLTDYLNSKIQNSSSGDWVDLVVKSIQLQAADIQQPEFKQAVIAATQTLAAHKDTVADLGIYGLTLFLQKVAVGKTEEAYLSFIRTQASFQDLIDGQEADAQAIIAAKQKSDEMRAKAIQFITEITLNGIRILIPFLLALI